jgi:hypothetical protein
MGTDQVTETVAIHHLDRNSILVIEDRPENSELWAKVVALVNEQRKAPEAG